VGPRLLAWDCRDGGSNAHCEQFDQAETDHQHREGYGIVVEPMPPLCVHDMPPLHPSLVGLAGRMVQMRRVGAISLQIDLKYGSSGAGQPR
jgi:hypothetical protein